MREGWHVWIEEASYILIVKESIGLITVHVIKTSLKGPEAIRSLASVQESIAGDVFHRFSITFGGCANELHNNPWLQ